MVIYMNTLFIIIKVTDNYTYIIIKVKYSIINAIELIYVISLKTISIYSEEGIIILSFINIICLIIHILKII